MQRQCKDSAKTVQLTIKEEKLKDSIPGTPLSSLHLDIDKSAPTGLDLHIFLQANSTYKGEIFFVVQLSTTSKRLYHFLFAQLKFYPAGFTTKVKV